METTDAQELVLHDEFIVPEDIFSNYRNRSMDIGLVHPGNVVEPSFLAVSTMIMY